MLLAPVLEGLDAEYQEIRFKYSLWDQSPYKGPPTPEVEGAWHDIMKCMFAPSIKVTLPSPKRLFIINKTVKSASQRTTYLRSGTISPLCNTLSL